MTKWSQSTIVQVQKGDGFMVAGAPALTEYEPLLTLLRYIHTKASGSSNVREQDAFSDVYARVCVVMCELDFSTAHSTNLDLLADLDTLRANTQLTTIQKATLILMNHVRGLHSGESASDRWILWAIRLERIAARYESADPDARNDLLNAWHAICAEIAQTRLSSAERRRLELRISNKLAQYGALISESRALLQQLRSS